MKLSRNHLRHGSTLLSIIILSGTAACGTVGGSSPATVTPVAITVPTLPPTLADAGLLAPLATPDLTQLPLLAAHLAQVQAALRQPIPILLLGDKLTDAQKQAQDLAIKDARFQQNLFDPQTKQALRNEIFGIYPMRDSDLTTATAACHTDPCYRVEMYNYALNSYTAAAVDLTGKTVLDVTVLQNTQPDLPDSLVQIGLEIVTHAPEVATALGHVPTAEAANMYENKSALNGTRCERSQHLCVAPTFVSGNRALWAIADLTDGRLVGVRWTTVDASGPALTPVVGAQVTPVVTEKGLENDVIMSQYCEHNTALSQGGWQLNYVLTSANGLRISEVTFQGKPVIDNAKLVNWHVSYSHQDGFGYSDAVGCPVFSQSAVIAVRPPYITDLVQNGQTVGFALTQDFWSELWPKPCNYYYEQRYEFYLDGRFRPTAASFGRGCGNDGTYRPVTRIAFSGTNTFSEWNGSGWKDWSQEGWKLQTDVPANQNGYQDRLIDSAGSGFYVEPSRGQFNDGGRGDNPFLYVTLRHPNDPGDADLPAIGPCCNTDYQQGPEKFMSSPPAPISNAPLVIWYVPQLKNDDSPGHEYCWADSLLQNGVYVPKIYPCVSGPLFVPIKPSVPNPLPATQSATPRS